MSVEFIRCLDDLDLSISLVRGGVLASTALEDVEQRKVFEAILGLAEERLASILDVLCKASTRDALRVDA